MAKADGFKIKMPDNEPRQPRYGVWLLFSLALVCALLAAFAWLSASDVPAGGEPEGSSGRFTIVTGTRYTLPSRPTVTTTKKPIAPTTERTTTLLTTEKTTVTTTKLAPRFCFNAPIFITLLSFSRMHIGECTDLTHFIPGFPQPMIHKKTVVLGVNRIFLIR